MDVIYIIDFFWCNVTLLYGGMIICLPGQPSHPAVSERGKGGSGLPEGNSPQQVGSYRQYTWYT